MIQSNNRPKRNKEFIHKETGETWYLNRDKGNGIYFVCDSTEHLHTDRYETFNKDSLKEAISSRTPIASKVKPVSESKKNFKSELNEFFDRQALQMPYNCMECSKPLYAFTKFAKRSVSAHILRKSDFPTIATNSNNLIFLGCSLIGVCSCHNSYDDLGAEQRTKMKIYPLILERFELLKPLLTSKELIKAYTYLNLKWQ